MMTLSDEIIRLGLAAKLAICVIASTAAFFALFGYINLRMERSHSEELVEQSADRITDIILRSTHYEMLHNDRDALLQHDPGTGQRAGHPPHPHLQQGRPHHVLHRCRRSRHGGGQERRGLLRVPCAIGAARPA